jgi:hypothetical protein
MQTALTRSGVSSVLRALLPLVLSVCLLVAGLVVAPGSATPATPADAPADTRALTNNTANVTLYDAGDRSFDDAGEVETAINDGRVTEPDTMAVNETLLVVIESERLASAMDERDGSTTERFVAALDGSADLYVVQTNPTTMVTRTFALVGTENATAHRDGETVYALLDTGALSFRKKGNEGFRPQDSFREDRFAVDFGFDLYEPPWEPPGDGPEGPTFTLSSGEYLTETPESTPTDSSTAPRTTTERTLTPGLATTTDRALPSEETTSTDTTQSRSGSSPQTGTQTTLHSDGPGFTAVTILAALFVLVLSGLRRR